MPNFEDILTERHDAASPISFVIVHRHRQRGGACLPGEEVIGVWLEQPGEPQLRLSLSLLLLFDHLGKHRWISQTAAQIEATMRSDSFYLRHAANIRGTKKLVRRISRSAVKIYIARIRIAMQLAFAEAGVALNPAEILVSHSTVSNAVGYRLHARVRWIHLP